MTRRCAIQVELDAQEIALIFRTFNCVSITGIETMESVLATVAKLKAALADPQPVPPGPPGEPPKGGETSD